MAEIADLKPVDAQNTARFNEGQKVPTLNNGARALEGLIARWVQDTNGTITSTGTAPNYAVATNAAYPALVNGMVVVWRAHAAFASGTATLTVNALAQKNLVRQTGNALAPGDIVQYQTVVSRYNSNADAYECLGIVGFATQAQMETATATNVAVAPGTQIHHPAHPKARINFNGSGTIAIREDFGVASLVDNGTGDYSMPLDTAVSNTSYAISGAAGTGVNRIVTTKIQSATAPEIAVTRGSDSTNQDEIQVHVILCGDQ